MNKSITTVVYRNKFNLYKYLCVRIYQDGHFTARQFYFDVCPRLTYPTYKGKYWRYTRKDLDTILKDYVRLGAIADTHCYTLDY